MVPTLQPGQGLIATPLGCVRVGQIRCFEHPERPGFWLVKRVSAVHDDQMTVRSDNREAHTVDSATFGDVPVAGSYRVLLAIPLRWM